MPELNLCKDVLINVNKIIVNDVYKCQYIKFAECLDQYLKKVFGKYYICDQINQDRDSNNTFYVEAFYRNIPGIYKAIQEINKAIEHFYNSEFGNCVKRISITNFSMVTNAYPNSNEICKNECYGNNQNNNYCDIHFNKDCTCQYSINETEYLDSSIS